MDNITIGIIVVIVILFLAMIYIYKDLNEKIEMQEREHRDMETRIIDEISDLKKVANKATIASAAASAESTKAALTVKSINENFAISASNSNMAPPIQHRGPAPGAALRATGAPGLPNGFRAAISSARENGLSQDHHLVAEEVFDPNKAKTVSPATAAAMAPKSRAPVVDGSGMEEAPLQQLPEAPPSIPQMFTGGGQGPVHAALPGINYEAITKGFATDQDFSVDAYDYDLGDPNADLYLN